MKITRAQGHFGLELAVNLLLPWLTYRLLAPHVSEFAAIAWSAAPPMLWSLAELARHRSLDALSLLVLGGIALSLVALLFGGSPRMLMVRENLFTIPIGLLFLVSLLMKKPLIYYAARATFMRQDPAGVAGARGGVAAAFGAARVAHDVAGVGRGADAAGAAAGMDGVDLAGGAVPGAVAGDRVRDLGDSGGLDLAVSRADDRARDGGANGLRKEGWVDRALGGPAHAPADSAPETARRLWE